MPQLHENEMRRKILDENRRVHALENRFYLKRHPEQTNWWQTLLLNETLDDFCHRLNKPAARLLDAGCGSGYAYLPMLLRGYEMTGVDLSTEMIAALEENLSDNLKARSNLKVADIEKFADNCIEPFDGVILSALLHHLFDYRKVVRSICKTVKPGGLFLIFFEPLKRKICFPFRYVLHKYLARLDEAIYRKKMQFHQIEILENEYEYSDYQRQFGGIDADELANLLRQEGMEILATKCYCARRNGLAAWIANKCLGTVNTFNLLAKKIAD